MVMRSTAPHWRTAPRCREKLDGSAPKMPLRDRMERDSHQPTRNFRIAPKIATIRFKVQGSSGGSRLILFADERQDRINFQGRDLKILALSRLVNRRRRSKTAPLAIRYLCTHRPVVSLAEGQLAPSGAPDEQTTETKVSSPSQETFFSPTTTRRAGHLRLYRRRPAHGRGVPPPAPADGDFP